MSVPRLRMFAGPNGSGKSSLKPILAPKLLGVYLNADDVEVEIGKKGNLDLAAIGLKESAGFLVKRLHDPGLVERTGNVGLDSITASGQTLDLGKVKMNSYVAAVIVGFLRDRLLKERVTFTMETVMSHPSKVEILKEAQALGYKTYLNFVATRDPEINVSRVSLRVAAGGHDVPEDKIVARYYRSIKLLPKAIKHTDRTYIFDNSYNGQESKWVAEVTGGKEISMKEDTIPKWFADAVLRQEF